MTDIQIDTSILTKPLDYISKYWSKRIQKRDELVKSLWDLMLYFNDLGIKDNGPNTYKITFSPTYYVNDKLGSKKTGEVIFDIVKLLQKYGWENPEIVPILYEFKVFLESYRRCGDDSLLIEDRDKFVKRLEENVNSLQKLITNLWSRPSQFRKTWLLIKRYFLLPISLSSAIFIFLSYFFLHERFKFYFNLFINEKLWLSILVESLLLGYLITIIFLKKFKKQKTNNKRHNNGMHRDLA